MRETFLVSRRQLNSQNLWRILRYGCNTTTILAEGAKYQENTGSYSIMYVLLIDVAEVNYYEIAQCCISLYIFPNMTLTNLPLPWIQHKIWYFLFPNLISAYYIRWLRAVAKWSSHRRACSSIQIHGGTTRNSLITHKSFIEYSRTSLITNFYKVSD